jgi:hypothetical protein
VLEPDGHLLFEPARIWIPFGLRKIVLSSHVLHLRSYCSRSPRFAFRAEMMRIVAPRR